MVRLPIRDAELVPNSNGSLFDYVSSDILVKIEVSGECSSCYHLRRGQCQLDSQGKFLCIQGTLFIDGNNLFQLAPRLMIYLS